MNASERMNAVLRGVQASLTGDSSVVAEIFAADVRATLPDRIECAAELAVEIEDRRDVFDDVQVSIRSVVEQRARLWVEWSAAVTHVGALVVAGAVIGATGRRAGITGITVADFAGFRIVGFRQYWDCTGLVRTPDPGADRLIG